MRLGVSSVPRIIDTGTIKIPDTITPAIYRQQQQAAQRAAGERQAKMKQLELIKDMQDKKDKQDQYMGKAMNDFVSDVSKYSGLYTDYISSSVTQNELKRLQALAASGDLTNFTRELPLASRKILEAQNKARKIENYFDDVQKGLQENKGVFTDTEAMMRDIKKAYLYKPDGTLRDPSEIPDNLDVANYIKNPHFNKWINIDKINQDWTKQQTDSNVTTATAGKYNMGGTPVIMNGTEQFKTKPYVQLGKDGWEINYDKFIKGGYLDNYLSNETAANYYKNKALEIDPNLGNKPEDVQLKTIAGLVGQDILRHSQGTKMERERATVVNVRTNNESESSKKKQEILNQDPLSDAWDVTARVELAKDRLLPGTSKVTLDNKEYDDVTSQFSQYNLGVAILGKQGLTKVLYDPKNNTFTYAVLNSNQSWPKTGVKKNQVTSAEVNPETLKNMVYTANSNMNPNLQRLHQERWDTKWNAEYKRKKYATTAPK